MLESKVLATAPIVLYLVGLTVEDRARSYGLYSSLFPATESACFESHPVPTGLQLLVTFEAAPYLAFVVLYPSPLCFGPPVDTIVSGREDTCLGAMHLMVGTPPADPNLKFRLTVRQV